MLGGRPGDLPPDPSPASAKQARSGAMAFLAARPEPATALAPEWLEVAVLVGQLTSNTFSHDVKITH
jgi:hypothetical protein